MNNLLLKIKPIFNINFGLKIMSLVLIILVSSWGFTWYYLNKSGDPIQFVQIDLVKISSDYMQKSILLVASVNSNSSLTPDQKLAKAQNIMKVVGNSIDEIVNEYSKANKVVVIQKQMIASDAGYQLTDITDQVESQIDSKINPNDLHNAVTK